MSAALSIEVRDIAKSFRIPAPDQSLLSRVRAGNPFRAAPGRQLDVLTDVSFDVRRGEFFGVVGRNGSGKSTLLKAIAGVYGVDRGKIRVAGRLAPFLELGLGFNPDLPAEENVVMNAVMMGLSTREARLRCDQIIDFAGLDDYTDLKLKNYSSGMRVRLGFAVMTQVDADVLLVDEMLAVGDAEFAEKCEDAFERMHAEGRTIVLVTHSMDAINAYCERALVLHEGRIDLLGDPMAVSSRYVEINAEAAVVTHAETPQIVAQLSRALLDPALEMVEAQLLGADGEPTDSLDPGEPIDVRARVRFRRDLDKPTLVLRLADAHQRLLFTRARDVLAPRAEVGQEFELQVTVDNHLAGGRYLLECRVDQGTEGSELLPASRTKMIRFEVRGERDTGYLALGAEVRIEAAATGDQVL